MKNVFPLLFVMLSLSCVHPPAKLTPPPAPEIITSVPFALHDNRILVKVMLNGEGPFSMIFDTGGANTITPRVQRRLGLISQGMDTGMGAGSAPFPYHSVHMRSLKLGAMTLQEQKFMVMDLERIRRTFRFPELDGIIGLELLMRAKVRIDFDNQMLWVLKPSINQTLPNARVLPFEMHDDSPVIEGSINGKPAKILVDTGDRSNLTLFHKFAKSSELDALFARRERLVTGMGLGGPIPGKIAALNSVKLGSQEVTDVLGRLPLTTGGYFAVSDLSASVGLGLLKAFNLEFDYQNRRLSLQPRPGFNEPSTFVPVRR